MPDHICPAVVGLYGVSAVGKTVLSQSLLSGLKTAELISTDHLKWIQRMVEPEGPYVSLSSYTAWRAHGACSLETIKRGLDGYRRTVYPFIDILVDRARDEEFILVIDGIHFSPEVSHRNDILILPVLLTVMDEDRHRKRLREKAAGRRALWTVINDNFSTVRTIQNILLSEAEREAGLTIDTADTSKRSAIRRILQRLSAQ